MTLVLVVVAVSGALVAGAVWGAFGAVPTLVQGLLLSAAAGALITSIAFELVEPAVDDSGLGTALVALVAGAFVFTGVDYLIDERWRNEGGLGILAAVTLDGIPENLALGVALIGASLGDVAALAGAILLSNFPEAAGGAQDLAEAGWSRRANIGLWTATAVLLSMSTVLGRLLLVDVPQAWLGAAEAFAAGAVLASLATEVVPEAFRDAKHGAGIAITVGFVLTFLLTG
jgi:zinc transporter, ZIP family